MSKKKDLIRNVLVLGIIILLMGIAVQPGTATVQNDLNFNNKKDTLFQTIIDITNNKDFNNLINSENSNDFYFEFDYNLRKDFRDIFFENLGFFSSLLFTKTSLTHNQLESAYEKGSELINTIGEDKALELVDSIKIKNPKLSNGISDILEENEEIRNKIEEIKMMNREIKPTSPSDINPIICGILLMLTFTFAIPMVSICVIILTLSTRPLLGPFFVLLLGLFSANLALFLTLVKTFCT
jgi:hypothetical protein